MIDTKKVQVIEFEGIDHGDYPDYCDAFITRAEYEGRELTENEIEEISEDLFFVYDSLMSYLY